MTDSNDRNTKIRQAYSAAAKRLREAHKQEFDTLQAEEAQRLGVDWKPRPTNEDKAARQFAELLRDNPGLAEKFAREAAEKAAEQIETGTGARPTPEQVVQQ